MRLRLRGKEAMIEPSEGSGDANLHWLGQEEAKA